MAKKPKIDKKRRQIAPTVLRERAVSKKLAFFASGRDRASILVASARSRALLGVSSGVPSRPWGPSGRFRRSPGTPRDAPEMLPRRLRDALERHGASREPPELEFDSILGAPGTVPAPILDRFLRTFSQCFCKRAAQLASEWHALRLSRSNLHDCPVALATETASIPRP